MAKSSASKFTYGHAYDLNDYAADGTVFDYMAGKRNVWTRMICIYNI